MEHCKYSGSGQIVKQTQESAALEAEDSES